MIAENSKIIEELIAHLQLGKPILNKRRRPIVDYTAYKYRVWLKKLDTWFAKPFSKITEADLDNFRIRLKQDVIRNNSGKPYSDVTKKDIEEKFLKTLFNYLGKPELAMFVITYKENTEIPSISKTEAYKIVSQARLRDKVIFQVLFDGGFRATEFRNIRFKDIKDDELEKNGYYKIWIRKSKTIPRTVGLTLPETTEILKEWLDVNKDKIGTEAPLIDLSYRHLNLTIRRLSELVIKKRITPHQLRHSSATYYCHYLSRYQLCKRYGWAMASDMPQRYIDREGVEDEQINNKVVAEENMTFKRQVSALQEQLNQKTELIKNMENRYNDTAQLVSDLANSVDSINKKIKI